MKTTCGHGETGRCGYCAQEQNIADHNAWRRTQGLGPINAAGRVLAMGECDGCGADVIEGKPHDCPVLGTTVTVEPIQ